MSPFPPELTHPRRSRRVAVLQWQDTTLVNSPNILPLLLLRCAVVSPSHRLCVLPFVASRHRYHPFSSSFCKATILSSVTITESIPPIDFCQSASYSLVRASARDSKVHLLEVDPRLKAQVREHLQKQGYEPESFLPSLGLVKRQNGWLKSSH